MRWIAELHLQTKFMWNMFCQRLLNSSAATVGHRINKSSAKERHFGASPNHLSYRKETSHSIFDYNVWMHVCVWSARSWLGSIFVLLKLCGTFSCLNAIQLWDQTICSKSAILRSFRDVVIFFSLARALSLSVSFRMNEIYQINYKSINYFIYLYLSTNYILLFTSFDINCVLCTISLICFFFSSFSGILKCNQKQICKKAKILSNSSNRNHISKQTYWREKCNSISVIRSLLWEYIFDLNNVSVHSLFVSGKEKPETQDRETTQKWHTLQRWCERKKTRRSLKRHDWERDIWKRVENKAQKKRKETNQRNVTQRNATKRDEEHRELSDTTTHDCD